MALEKRDCDRCSGSGGCWWCSGTGWREKTYDGEVTLEKCDMCQGTGVCHFCQGRGWVLVEI